MLFRSDGLAMSSRNKYLDPAQRAAAAVLSRTLAAGGAVLQAGERDANRLQAMMQAMIAAEPLARLDYISVAHPRTLAELVVVEDEAVLSTAVFFHRTRLIDNMLWHN